MSDGVPGRVRARSAPPILADGRSAHIGQQRVGRTGRGVVVTVLDPGSQPRAEAPPQPEPRPLGERKASIRNRPKQLSLEESANGLKALVGKSIDPKVCDFYADVIQFNHLGQIVGLRGKPLTNADLEKLQNSVISDLAATNRPGERGAPRIETEIIFDFIAQLQDAAQKSGDPDGLLALHAKTLKELWFQGANGRTTCAALRSAEAALKERHPELALSAGKLAQEASAKKFHTQRQDNILARRFETEVVKRLVLNPPKAALRAANAIGRSISIDVEAKIEKSHNPRLVWQEMARTLGALKRPYVVELPNVQKFISFPSRFTFLDMFSEENNFDIIKVNWICGVAKDVVDLPWAGEGLEFYRNAIVPARSATHSVLSTGVAMIPRFIRDLGKDINRLISDYGDFPLLVSIRATLEEVQMDFAEGGTEVQQCLGALAALRRDFLQRKDALRRGNASPEALLSLTSDFEKQDAELRGGAKKALVKAANNLKSSLAVMEGLGGILNKTATIYLNRLNTELTKALADIDRYAAILSLVEGSVNINKMNASPIKTRDFGTFLPYQGRPDFPGRGTWPERLALQTYLHIDVEKPTKFERSGLLANRYFATGASGTMILLINAYRHARREAGKSNQTVNIGDALLGALMYLTFDGGHSFSESYGTIVAFADYLSEPHPNAETARLAAKTLDDFVLNYRDLALAAYGASPETQQAVHEALEEAFNQTLSEFREMRRERGE